MEGRVNGTNTIFFIATEDLYAEIWKDVTYGRIVVSYRPENSNPNRVRLTVGSDRINYPDNYGTPTADMMIVKLLIPTAHAQCSAQQGYRITHGIKTPNQRPKI